MAVNLKGKHLIGIIIKRKSNGFAKHALECLFTGDFMLFLREESGYAVTSV